MIIVNYNGLRKKALELMKSEDEDFTQGMENFRRVAKRKSIYLEPVKTYSSKSQLIVCGPLQRVPNQAVYTTDSIKEQEGSRAHLYVGNHSIVSQTAYIPFGDRTDTMKNEAMIYIYDHTGVMASLKKVMIQDFARLCFSERYSSDYGFFIFKTSEDKKLILGTLEEMADEIKAIESRTGGIK